MKQNSIYFLIQQAKQQKNKEEIEDMQVNDSEEKVGKREVTSGSDIFQNGNKGIGSRNDKGIERNQVNSKNSAWSPEMRF